VNTAQASAAATIRRLAESMKIPGHPLALTDRRADSWSHRRE
jgi:hypothetical protein